MELERTLRRVVVSISGEAVIFGWRLDGGASLLERLSERPPVLDRWAEAIVAEKIRRQCSKNTLIR